MKLLFYLFIGLFAVVLSFNKLLSQEEVNPSKDSPQKDTTQTERVNILPDDDFGFSYRNNDFKFKFEMKPSWSWKPKKPFITAEVGQANYSNKDYSEADFNTNTAISLILGYYKDANINKSTLYSHETDDFFITYYSDKLYDFKTKNTGYKTDNWQFGFNWGKGYGNEFHNNFKLYFNYKSGFSWSRFKLRDETNLLDSIFIERFNRYNEKLKFGEQFQSSGSIVLFELINLNASYQRMHVYPAHMFWYWILSESIEVAAHSLLDEFVDEIKKFSPELTPVFNIILKTGLSYGIYELRRNNMNWPINTEPPFVIENFKVGLGFNF